MTRIDIDLETGADIAGVLEADLRFDAGPAPCARSSPLYALTRQLGGGEALEVSYALAPEDDAPLHVRIALSLRAPSVEAFAARRARLAEAARDAVRLSFGDAVPDWLTEPLHAARGRARADLPPPAFVAPRTMARVGPRLVAVDDTALAAALPRSAATPPDIGRLLAALISLGKPAAAVVTLRPVVIDAERRRRLDGLHALLHAAGRDRTGLSEFELVHARDLVARWRGAGRGVEVRFAIDAERTIELATCDALSAALHGAWSPAAPLCDAAMRLDLSASVLEDDLHPEIAAPARVLAASAAAARGRERSASGLLLGETRLGAAVTLSEASRSRHLFVCGATGVGKSSLIARLALADIRAGAGVILVDPHGDLVSEIGRLAPGRALVADAGDFDDPFTLNILQVEGPHQDIQRNFIANQLIRVLRDTLYAGTPEAFGPVFEMYFRNALMLVMTGGGPEATLADFERVFAEPAYRRKLLDECEDERISMFWRGIALKAGGELGLENVAPYIISKLTQFIGNPAMRRIVCAPRSSLDLPGEMARGEARLISLAKGAFGETEAALLGGLIATKLFAAALSRASLASEARGPVRVYLDEFQTYAAEPIGSMLAESRKYGIEVTLATQSLARLRHLPRGGAVAEAILGNVANLVAFRSGPDDARLLAEWMGDVEPLDLMRLDDHEAVARLLDDGRMRRPLRFRAAALTP